MTKAPVIGISCGSNSVSGSLVAVVTQIRSAGGIPKVLQNLNAEEHLHENFACIDALVLMGNYDDVDPAAYGQQVHPATNVEKDGARRHFEEAAIRLALEAKMPLMGICGGMQRINTLDHGDHGGTLHQHLPDLLGHDRHSQGEIAPFMPVQPILVESSSVLACIAGGAGKWNENSFHHQAVDAVHGQFTVSARSDDGIIEAIEPRRGGRYAEQFVLGVQWHPEFGASELGARLAQSLVQEAARFVRSPVLKSLLQTT